MGSQCAPLPSSFFPSLPLLLRPLSRRIPSQASPQLKLPTVAAVTSQAPILQATIMSEGKCRAQGKESGWGREAHTWSHPST